MSAPAPRPGLTPPGLARPGPPLWLLLELTYRCPLHCAFCYNPTDFARTGPELATEDWLRVLREARALGAVQLGLSGGEPLSRDDLEPIVGSAPARLLHQSDHLRSRTHRDADPRAKDRRSRSHPAL